MVIYRSKMHHVPAVVFADLDDIKREDGIKHTSSAFLELVRYARVGREAKRLATLKFGKTKPLPKVERRGKIEWL
jgi:hypothetical protein